jgi:thioredoxin reductase (NADPH)
MSNETIKRDVVILGSGPAGLTAAIYTARASLKPLLVDAPADAEKQTTPGGQLMITTDVENYPGFAKGIDGPGLMAEFRDQAERFGTEFMEAWISEVDLSERPFQLYTSNGVTISTETLIIATGASAKWLGIPGEAKVPAGFGGNGVSACATCDGPLPAFRNKVIVVVGGGDTAMEEATFLTRYASKVYVVHRRDKLRASKIMQEKAFRNEKIEFIWNSTVDEIVGTPEEGVTGVRLSNLQTGEERVFRCSGVFVAIGDWLPEDVRTLDGYEYSGSLRVRRRAGFCLSSGSDGSRDRVHVRDRRRALPGSLTSRHADRRRNHDRRRAHHVGSQSHHHPRRPHDLEQLEPQKGTKSTKQRMVYDFLLCAFCAFLRL